MATLTVQIIALAGITPTLVAAAGGGDEFVNSGSEFIHIANGGGGSINVTVDSQAACNQGSDHDAVVAVPAGEERFIGPFPKDRFNDSDGKVQIAYSGVTSVTVGIVRLP
jgi:hypothetical protein